MKTYYINKGDKMDINKIKEKVFEIIKNNVQVDKELSPNDKIEDLGIDSLTFVKIIVAIESEFGFQFLDEELDKDVFVDINSFIKYVHNKKL